MTNLYSFDPNHSDHSDENTTPMFLVHVTYAPEGEKTYQRLLPGEYSMRGAVIVIPGLLAPADCTVDQQTCKCSCMCLVAGVKGT
jgi:hypothetical protein